MTESSLHRIASDLDVKDHTAMDEILDDVKSITQIGICYSTRYNALTIAKVQMLNKPYVHCIDIKVMNNVSRKPLD